MNFLRCSMNEPANANILLVTRPCRPVIFCPYRTSSMVKLELLLCISLAFLCFPRAGNAGDSFLGHTWGKLARNNRLVIGYLGGSITEGAGASDASRTSWRALTTDWFKRRFPQADISEANAAIGGTGSELGAFRCQRDLICKKPDLVFVEFAVNDSKSPEAKVVASMEGIVRQILAGNPEIDIVFVYTTMRDAEKYSEGEELRSVSYHQRVAGHYGIPSINVGKALRTAILEGRATWESMTKDGTHPLDAGYSLYAGKVCEFLEAHIGDMPPPAKSALPRALSENPMETAKMLDGWSANAPGWNREDISLANRFPHRITSCVPGTELTVPFSGSVIGVYWLVARDSGNIEYSIDGGPLRTVSSWDQYALQFDRANYRILEDGLPQGQHLLMLRVSETKAEQSAGNWIRIGAFLSR